MRASRILVVTLALSSPPRLAVADSDNPQGERSDEMEMGAYVGGWFSNHFHDFYGTSSDEVRKLEAFNPALGLRFAYFPHQFVGGEAELQYTMAKLRDPGSDTPIYGLRAHAIGHYPGRVTPFAVVGVGWSRLSSSDALLGSDTDVFVHLGAGAKYTVRPGLALRVDLRLLRGPSSGDKDAGANYGELMFGVSFSPRFWRVKQSKPVPKSGPEPEPEPISLPVQKFEDDEDGDGVRNENDACPEKAEDKDGFEDEDGCPDPDNDKDGIDDKADRCPNEPEDQDGYQDRDGCDDPDNDGDGIPDVIDQCAIEAETINGNKDEDGCPDAGESLVIVMPARIEVFEAIQFRGKTARILKKSHNVLAQVGASMRANRDILRLGINVHVHPRGAADYALTKQRAKAVRKWLIDWGVEPERLVAKGHGSRVLLVAKNKRGAKSINDRVEFPIIEKRVKKKSKKSK